MHLIGNCVHRSKTSFPNNQQKLRQMKILRRREKGAILHICELRSRFKVILPQILKKVWKKKIKTKNKGVNSELRALFKEKFSIFRNKDEKNEKVQKNDKVDKEREKGIILYISSNFRPSFKVKLKRKKTFQFALFWIRFIYLLSIANSTEIGN